MIVTGRDKTRAQAAAAEIGGRHHGLALDLTKPDEIIGALSTVGPVDHLVLAAIERVHNSVRNYDTGRAIKLLTLKVVGYTAVVHALASLFSTTASILVLGGMARDWPYPRSTLSRWRRRVGEIARSRCGSLRRRHSAAPMATAPR